MKTIVIAQARMGSTRAPGKVMRLISWMPVLAWTLRALIDANVGEVVLATSTLPADDVIADWCAASVLKNTVSDPPYKGPIPCFRGSESDVLDRFYKCAKEYRADIVLRITCDCPFIDPEIVRQVVALRERTGADYASNIDPPTYPDGLDVECFTMSALDAAWQEAERGSDRDCVPQFISRNRHRFKTANLTCGIPGLQNERWVLDTEKDYEFCVEVANLLPPRTVSMTEILAVLDAHPEIRAINAGGIRNERFYEAIHGEQLPARTFERSARVFDRAIQTIPFGAQTFSKSHIQFPRGRAPLYCTHADGARIFDVDGNDYVDLVNAVLPVVLGYRDPDVDLAIRQQLDRGISFTLATELEAEVAETLVKLIPCAEKVKFGKSGTDVTSAAIRLARAYTGRDYVALSGYHGWADWSMAPTDRSLGIPDAVKRLSKRFDINDLETLKKLHPEGLAAVIVEPNERTNLPELREYCTRYGIVLIFDEIITGFRYSTGGAQRLYDVTPDLATFGKAMANGMPLSAIVGRERIMKLMEPPNNIFYSGTMFGEALSLAAAKATIKKLKEEAVIPYLWNTGRLIRLHVEEQIQSLLLGNAISIGGADVRTILSFRDCENASANQLRTLFMQEMIQGGVLIINSNNVSFAIKVPELHRIRSAYTRALTALAKALASGDIAERVGEVVEAAPLRATA